MKQKIVLATSNVGKIKEINALLASSNLHIVPQSDFNIPDAVEDGLSFIENALIKARHAAKLANLPAIADDSGLEVDVLGGAPGIYSARYAGEPADHSANIIKLLNALQEVPLSARTARFRCVIVYLRHALDPAPLVCQGTWEGLISLKRQGEGGFGYDPVFFVPNHQCTAAQLAPEVKNALSHRGKALRELTGMLMQHL